MFISVVITVLRHEMGAVAVLFHWPKLPVIVISPRGLAAALDRKKLIAVLGAQTPIDTKFEVRSSISQGASSGTTPRRGYWRRASPPRCGRSDNWCNFTTTIPGRLWVPTSPVVFPTATRSSCPRDRLSADGRRSDRKETPQERPVDPWSSGARAG